MMENGGNVSKASSKTKPAPETEEDFSFNSQFEELDIAGQVSGKKRAPTFSTKMKTSPNTSPLLLSNSFEVESGDTAYKSKPKKKQMKDDDIVSETFHHRSGKQFQCIYQSGMRFYLDDWGSEEWQPFPKRWYNEGLLVTNTILKNENAENDTENDHIAGEANEREGSGGENDDREGFLMHPTKGRIPTYIFYKKHNVHMYFDRDTYTWVRTPINWELHQNMAQQLVDQVDDAVPTWGDRHDILAQLRACNYDPDECIAIYERLEKDEWMKKPKTPQENKELAVMKARNIELEKRVEKLETELKEEKEAKQDAKRNLELQMTKFSKLEAVLKE